MQGVPLVMTILVVAVKPLMDDTVFGGVFFITAKLKRFVFPIIVSNSVQRGKKRGFFIAIIVKVLRLGRREFKSFDRPLR